MRLSNTSPLNYQHKWNDVVNGSMSNMFIQQRGVPQGSTLVPLLFSIVVNELPLICSKCCVQHYADDGVILHLYCTSQTNLSQIESALQSVFNTLQRWLVANKLLLYKTMLKLCFSLHPITSLLPHNVAHNRLCRFILACNFTAPVYFQMYTLWLLSLILKSVR